MSPGAPPDATVEASVVVVLAGDRSAGDAGAAVEVVRAAAPQGCEVVAVLGDGNGGDDVGPAAAAPGGGAAWDGVRVVAVDRPVPFGAAANLGAAAAVGRTLCFLAAGARPAPGWLPPLVAAVGDDGVAGAVPRVVDAGGRVVEAGCALDRDGAVVALSAGAPATSLEHAFPRRVDGGSCGCICVRRSSFVAAGGFDPALDGLVPAGMDLAASLRTAGLATVFVPASTVALDDGAGAGELAGPSVAAGSAAGRVLRQRWSATVPAGRPVAAGTAQGPTRPAAFRDADCPERILVVARGVPAPTRTYGERRLVQLLGDLAALVPDGRLTLLAADGHAARERAPALLRRGIEVVAGPEDWDEWLERRRLLFSHVVITDFPTLRRMDGVLRRTQPQARRILCPPSVNFPDEAAREATGAEHDDAPGIRLLVRHLQEQVEQAAADSDAAWCATEGDRTWLAAAAPDLPCAVVPTAAATGGGGGGFALRSGYVVLAAPGADIVAGHDDAALYAARTLLPRLLEGDPTAFLRIVVDDPAPALQLLAGRHIELVPAGDDAARWLRRSLVCLAWYPRGSGSRQAITLALDARTPFVTSEAALRDAGMAHLPALSGAVDAASAALLAGQLHGDRRRWDDAAAELDRTADGPRSRSAARVRLLRACADSGIAPRPGITLEDPLPAPAVDEGPARPRHVAVVGSAWKEAPPAPDGAVPELPPHGPDPDEVPVNDRYRRWQARYGPTRRRLDALQRRLDRMVRRPTFSIVMPVFNTEPSWLHDAISSVRAQVYGDWELCIGDDGSVTPGTLEVLEAHAREEPRIRFARLPGNQGISAASNAALALATGDFVGFLDHDDELKPHALGEIAVALDHQPDLDLLYTDEDKREPDGRLVDPFFKPDWSPDHLMSRNYVCHFLVVRRALLEKLGGLRSAFDGSQDYDLVLRAMEVTDRIAHVHEPLYTWRKVAGSTSSVADAKPWALDSARRALQDALDRRGTPGEVVDGMHPATYRVRYALRGRPTVSVLIPTRDRVDLLRNCIDSIRRLSTYTDYELVVVDNETTDAETLAYLATLPGRVVRYPHRFNYARMMNLAAQEAKGDLLLFLNNDTQVRSPDWLEAMIEHGQRPEVGLVGARLLYPNGHAQHEGIIVGHKGGHAGNVDHGGFWGLGHLVRNCSAVTGACMMVRPSVYWEVGGHDERLRIAWNDVDLGLRVRQAGYEVVYTPYAELFHVEGGTRGIHAHVDDDDFFEARWVTHKCLDPYYNANLERLHPFRIRG